MRAVLRVRGRVGRLFEQESTSGTIAFPNIASARKAGNETSAIGSLRTLIAVNEQFRTRFGRYAPDLDSLVASGYIDSVLGGAAKSGYLFNYTGGTYGWDCHADPEIVGTTGDRFFYVSVDGVIHSSETAPAHGSDPPVPPPGGSPGGSPSDPPPDPPPGGNKFD